METDADYQADCNQSKFTQFFLARAEKVFGYFYARTKSRHEAEDLLSLTCQRFMESVENAANPSEDWGMILGRTILDVKAEFFREDKRRPVHVELLDEMFPTISGVERPIEDEIIANEERAILDSAIRYLKPVDQAILALSLMDFDNEQIAEQLSASALRKTMIAPKTVANRLSKIRKDLRILVGLVTDILRDK